MGRIAKLGLGGRVGVIESGGGGAGGAGRRGAVTHVFVLLYVTL